MVAIQGVVAAFGAVGYINIGPAVAIEIDDGDGSAHGSYIGHDVIELVIEVGSLVNKIHASGVRDFLEIKTVAGQSGLQIERGFG